MNAEVLTFASRVGAKGIGTDTSLSVESGSSHEEGNRKIAVPPAATLHVAEPVQPR